MGIARRRRGLRVAEQLADDGKPERGTGSEAGERMPEVVNAKAVEIGDPDHRAPRLVEVGAGSARKRAGDDVRIVGDASDRGQNRLGGGAQMERLPSRLGIRKKQNAALEVDLIPSRVENLAKPRAGQA